MFPTQPPPEGDFHLNGFRGRGGYAFNSQLRKTINHHFNNIQKFYLRNDSDSRESLYEYVRILPVGHDFQDVSTFCVEELKD